MLHGRSEFFGVSNAEKVMFVQTELLLAAFVFPITITMMSLMGSALPGLLGILGLVLLAVRVSRKIKRERFECEEMLEQHQRLREEGVESTAVIEGVTCDYTTNKGFSMHLLIDLALTKVDGAVVRTRIEKMVTQLEIPRYQLGQTLLVRYRPSDPKELEIVDTSA